MECAAVDPPNGSQLTVFVVFARPTDRPTDRPPVRPSADPSRPTLRAPLFQIVTAHPSRCGGAPDDERAAPANPSSVGTFTPVRTYARSSRFTRARPFRSPSVDRSHTRVDDMTERPDVVFWTRWYYSRFITYKINIYSECAVENKIRIYCIASDRGGGWRSSERLWVFVVVVVTRTR